MFQTTKNQKNNTTTVYILGGEQIFIFGDGMEYSGE